MATPEVVGDPSRGMERARPEQSGGRGTVAPGRWHVRVLQLIDSFGVGGAERLLPVLCPELRRLGLDIKCVALAERPRPNIQDDLEAAAVSTDVIGVRGLSRRSLQQVSALLVERRPDIVHAHLTYASVLGTLAAARQDLPCLVTLHQLGALTWQQPRDAARELLFRLVVGRLASRVIAVSEAVADYYRRRGVPSAKLAVVHNAVALEPLTRSLTPLQRARLLAEFGLSADARVVVTVAVLRRGKGIGVLLKALPLVIAREGRAVLLVVGDGPMRGRLEALAASLGLDHHIRFVGQRRDVGLLLRLGEVFVLPSRYEAFPTALLEALAAGLPSVASRVGGIPEIVVDGREALLTPAGDVGALAAAMSRLLEDEALRGRLAEAAAVRARAFSPPVWGQQLVSLYQSVLAEGASRPAPLLAGR